MKDIDIQYLKQFLNNPEENPSQGLPDGFNPIYVLQDIYKIAHEYFGIEDEILSLPVIEGAYDFNPTFTIEKVEGIIEQTFYNDEGKKQYSQSYVGVLWFVANKLCKAETDKEAKERESENEKDYWEDVEYYDALQRAEQDILQLYILVHSNPDKPILIGKDGKTFKVTNCNNAESRYSKKYIPMGDWFSELIDSKCKILFPHVESVLDAQKLLRKRPERMLIENRTVNFIIGKLYELSKDMGVISKNCSDFRYFAGDFLEFLGYDASHNGEKFTDTYINNAINRRPRKRKQEKSEPIKYDLSKYRYITNSCKKKLKYITK